MEHGFLKGSGRVGRSQKLEDRLKIQLAVNAHIRHRLTQYDSLLAANKGQDAKLAARDMVYRQVQAIADSWHDTSSQAQTSKTRMLISRDSAAILESNRQRRAQQGKANIQTTDETQILEEALGQLRLKENGDKEGTQVEVVQQMAQKKAQRKSRKSCSGKINQDLFHHYELYSSMGGLSKKKQKKQEKVRRLQKEQRKLSGKSNHPKGHDSYLPTFDRSVNVNAPRQSRYLLRSTRGTSVSIPMNDNRFSNDVQLQQREHENHMPSYGPSPITHPPRQRQSPQGNSAGKIGDLDLDNERVGSPLEKSRGKGMQMIEGSEWMDIDDIPLGTTGMHLA